MDAELLRIAGRTAGLAGLAIGLILLLYREIVRRSFFPTLSKTDAYRLLRNIVILSWSVAMAGILCWAWSTASLRQSQNETGARSFPEDRVVAGTIVDRSNITGIGQAIVTVDGEASPVTSDENGNFRIVLSKLPTERVRITVARTGYQSVDQSVSAPTHDLVLQLQAK